MYEPIRTKSVHSMAGADADTDFPHRTREEELDIQLAGHLAALLAVTDDLGLDREADRIAQQVTRLRGTPPPRTSASADSPRTCTAAHSPWRAGRWSSPPRGRTPRRRSSRPSGWTRTRRRSGPRRNTLWPPPTDVRTRPSTGIAVRQIGRFQPGPSSAPSHTR